MASFGVISATTSSIEVRCVCEGATYYYLYRDGTFLTHVTDGSGSMTYTYTGLNEGTGYYLMVRAYGPSGLLYEREIYASTLSSQSNPPSMPTGLSITNIQWDNANNCWECRFVWNSVSNAIGYYVYLNGVRQASTGSTYYYFYGIPPNTSFYFSVEAYNSNGASDRNTIQHSFGSAPVIVPINVTITDLQYQEDDNEIKIDYSIDAPAGHIQSVVISITRDDDMWHDVASYNYPTWRVNTYTFTHDGAGRAFIKGRRYYVRVTIYSITGGSDIGVGWDQHVRCIDIPLTLSFEWDYPKVSGQPFKVTTSEWISFQNKINNKRNTKGLSNYSFTIPGANSQFTANVFKESVYAIDQIYSKIGTTSQVASECRNVLSNDKIYAWYFENIKQAFNNA